jgi:hypothetical protein
MWMSTLKENGWYLAWWIKKKLEIYLERIKREYNVTSYPVNHKSEFIE